MAIVWQELVGNHNLVLVHHILVKRDWLHLILLKLELILRINAKRRIGELIRINKLAIFILLHLLHILIIILVRSLISTLLIRPWIVKLLILFMLIKVSLAIILYPPIRFWFLL